MPAHPSTGSVGSCGVASVESPATEIGSGPDMSIALTISSFAGTAAYAVALVRPETVESMRVDRDNAANQRPFIDARVDMETTFRSHLVNLYPGLGGADFVVNGNGSLLSVKARLGGYYPF